MVTSIKLSINKQSNYQAFTRALIAKGLIRHWVPDSYLMLADDNVSVQAVIRVTQFGGAVWIDEISVAEEQRRKGYARAALDLLTSIADSTSVTLKLHPKRVGNSGPNSTQLKAIYKKSGFVPDKAGSTVMTRLPK